jgi:hypothetical protein
MATLAVRLVLAIGAAFAVAVVLLALHRDQGLIVGTNYVAPAAFTITVPSHGRVCQAGAAAPRDAQLARFTVGTYGRRGVVIQAVAGSAGPGRPLRIARQGVVEVPLPAHLPTVASSLCLRNLSRTRIAIGGGTVARRKGAVVNGRRGRGVFSVTYLGPRRTWSDQVTAIVSRVGYAKGLLGADWTGPCVMFLVVSSIALTLISCVRWLRP